MNKQEQISKYMAEPLKKGDKVSILGLGTQDKTQWGNQVIVDDILPDNSIIYDSNQVALVHQWKKYDGEIGFNPFPAKRWDAAIRFVSFPLSNVLSICGFNYRTGEFTGVDVEGVNVPELNWNPTLTSNGVEICYQRDFCWTLKDKQLLIDSIYNGIEIGKIVIRNRTWEYVAARIKGRQFFTAFRDIVDGKQRLGAIIDFIRGEFADSEGRYWRDMSKVAQRKFMSCNALSFGEIGEGATDEDVKNVFININFAGVPMSQEHIDFVKGIKL